MILATQKILEIFKGDTKPDYEVVSALVSVVCKCGDISDADALLDCFLQQPADSYRRYLLDVVNLFGNETHTRRLIENCFEGDKLKDDFPTEILHTLGYVGDKNAVELLFQNAINSTDHYQNHDAVLGLLHYDCSEFESEILQAIEKTYGKNLFAEFTPALICKLSAQAEVLENLYKYGSTTTSTDCNGGVILGFSLCGKLGEEYFRKVLWDERWETYSHSTATAYWTFAGTQNLGISLTELYEEIRATEPEDEMEYKLIVFNSLLDIKIKNIIHPLRFIEPVEENFETIYTKLFSWKTPNEADNICTLAEKFEMEKDFYQLERKLEFRLEQEFYEKFRTKIER